MTGIVRRESIISVDYGVKDWVSVIISEGGRDSPFIFISSLGVVRRDKARGGVEGSRDRNVSRSRGVIVAVFSIHVDIAFVPSTE